MVNVGDKTNMNLFQKIKTPIKNEFNENIMNKVVT